LPSFVAGVVEKKRLMTAIVTFFCGVCCREKEGNDNCCHLLLWQVLQRRRK